MDTTIHQLKIHFQLSPTIQRYVYVYLIAGQSCWLIDSGVDGAEQIIEDYMRTIGRKLTDIRGIFLTHAHPDHIGSAAKIRELTGCKVYAGAGERPWIQDIELQFAQRPIPNFHTLVNKSVPVDEVLEDGDRIELENDLTVKALKTPGHSVDGLSYLLLEKHCVFTGDAIPTVGDIPIWIQAQDAQNSLEKLRNLKEADIFYPAWDITYDRVLALKKIDDAIRLMNELRQSVDRCKGDANSPEELVVRVCDMMEMPHFLQNPLFRKTIESYL